MNKNQKGVIDVTGVELTPGDLQFVLVTESKDLSIAATNVTTICFVFLNLIKITKKKILLRIKFVFDDHIKKDEEF